MFAPVEFLELAKALHTQATKESCARSAVSRAYYAAFLTAKERGNVVAQKGENIHQLVSKYFSNQLPSTADDLKNLRRRRNDADYELTHTFASKDSNWAIKTAEAIIEDLR